MVYGTKKRIVNLCKHSVTSFIWREIQGNTRLPIERLTIPLLFLHALGLIVVFSCFSDLRDQK